MRLFSIIWINLVLLFVSGTAFGYPELTRHNYNNCMVCHISPTGGGVLSQYGRSLSKELLSTWGYEGEENFMYLIPTTETVALGGDLRTVQIEDKLANGDKRKRWIHMQKDLEVAITLKKWVGAVSVGENTFAEKGSQMLSRRHYIMFKPTDEISLRGGKFFPSFGLHIPDHNTVIRRGLGWDQGQETYNLEGAYQGEKWHYFLTAILGRPDDETPIRQKGITFSTAYHPKDGHKYGLSYYYGENPDLITHMLGPYAVVGLTEHIYFLGQLTAVRAYPYSASDHQWGIIDYMRLNYEPFKGFHLFLAQEFSQTNLNTHATRTDTHSLGVQFFPRPHFEVQVMGQNIHSQGIQKKPTERLNVMLHFYP